MDGREAVEESSQVVFSKVSAGKVGRSGQVRSGQVKVFNVHIQSKLL